MWTRNAANVIWTLPRPLKCPSEDHGQFPYPLPVKRYKQTPRSPRPSCSFSLVPSVPAPSISTHLCLPGTVWRPYHLSTWHPFLSAHIWLPSAQCPPPSVQCLLLCFEMGYPEPRVRIAVLTLQTRIISSLRTLCKRASDLQKTTQNLLTQSSKHPKDFSPFR